MSATVAEQQELVKQLEEQLREAESKVLYFSRDQQQQQQQQQPEYHVHTISAEPTQEAVVIGRSTEVNGNGIMREPPTVAADITSTLWQDTDGNTAPGSHARDMRELWAKVMRAREPLSLAAQEKDKASRRDVDTDIDPNPVPRADIWTTKIHKEQQFVNNLTAVVRDEKIAIRRDQEVLDRRRVAWRLRKKSLNPRDVSGRSQLKMQSEDLNAQTIRLNDAVAQTRLMQGWLVQRTKKLEALHEYVRVLEESKEGAKGTVKDEFKGYENKENNDAAKEVCDMTLEVLRRLGQEMDSEVEVTMMDLMSQTAPTTDSSALDWLFVGATPTVPKTRSSGYSRGRSPKYVHHQYAMYDQQYAVPFQPPPPPRPSAQYHHILANSHPEPFSSHQNHGYVPPPPPREQNYPNNNGYNYYDNSYYPQPQQQQQQQQNCENNRWGSIPSVRFNLHGGGGMMMNPKQQHGIDSRRSGGTQLNDITNRR